MNTVIVGLWGCYSAQSGIHGLRTSMVKKQTCSLTTSDFISMSKSWNWPCIPAESAFAAQINANPMVTKINFQSHSECSIQFYSESYFSFSNKWWYKRSSPHFYTRNFKSIFRTPFGHFPDISRTLCSFTLHIMKHIIFNKPALRHMVRY